MAEKMSLLSPPESKVGRRQIKAAAGLTEASLQPEQSSPASRLDRIARGVVLRTLSRLRHGGLIVRDRLGEQRFGTGADTAESAVLRVDDLRFYRRVLFGGSLGAAESYLEGHWNADDLTGVLRVLGRNLAEFLASGDEGRSAGNIYAFLRRRGSRGHGQLHGSRFR